MSPHPHDDTVNEQYERRLFPEPARLLELPVCEGAKVRWIQIIEELYRLIGDSGLHRTD